MTDPKPLAGLLVLSLEQAVAAPYCSSRLADAGARVIKIERPEGDFARGYDKAANGLSSYFVWLNRGKQSLVADIKNPDDAALLHRILAQGRRVHPEPGARRRGARRASAPTHLRERYPRLITVDISGYGDTGDYATMKAYDLLVQAESGLAMITGHPAGPGRVGVSACDIACGMAAHAGVLEALIERGITGRGKGLKVSLFDGMADWMNVPLLFYEGTGKAPERLGLAHPSICPYGAFATADGALVLISIQNEREWAEFCARFLDEPDLPQRDGLRDQRHPRRQPRDGGRACRARPSPRLSRDRGGGQTARRQHGVRLRQRRRGARTPSGAAARRGRNAERRRSARRPAGAGRWRTPRRSGRCPRSASTRRRSARNSPPEPAAAQPLLPQPVLVLQPGAAYASAFSRRGNRMTVAAVAARRTPAAPDFGVLLAVLGVVYGDIGTSPLYAFKASLHCSGRRRSRDVEILGMLSLIFWSLILIVTVKYVHAGHARRQPRRGRHPGADGAGAARLGRHPACGTALALVGIAGACLFFGDGVITPAISVLSAVEGLEVVRARIEGVRAADRVGGDRRAVRRAVPRHRQRRPRVRPGHGGVVRRDRRCWASPRSCSIRTCCWRCRPATRSQLCIAIQGAGLHRAGRRGAVRHRGRGAVCRYGPFRRPADPADLDCSSCCPAWC